MKGLYPGSEGSPGSVLIDVLRKALGDSHVDFVMVPSAGPDDTFPWILVKNPEDLEKAVPLPPVMPVQGAKALASFTQSPSRGRILALMRPCEVRATIEMAKIQQIDLDDVILMSMDCHGVVPLAAHREDRSLVPDSVDGENLRALCRRCTEFTERGDLFLASHGEKNAIVPLTDKGRMLTDLMDLQQSVKLDGWKQWRDDLEASRKAVRKRAETEMKQEYGGLQGLARFFSGCIGCRNCRSVCPICYCRLCFIDMKDRRLPARDHLEHSRNAGAARLVSNTLLFHIGRMAHMSVSCVSCGMCEDACPSDIPVGSIVSMVSSETSGIFDYTAGENPDELLPLNTFQLDELHEYED